MKMLDSDSGGIFVTEGRSVVVMFGYEQGGSIKCYVTMQFLSQSDKERLSKKSWCQQLLPSHA